MSALDLADLQRQLTYCPATGVFRWRVDHSRVRIGDIAGTLNSRGYRKIEVGGRSYAAHRLAWLFVNGKWPSADIDHINRIKDDNRIANLRDVSRAINNRNKGAYKTCTTGHVGVFPCKYGYRAVLIVGGRAVLRRRFKTMDAAVAARRAAEEAFNARSK